jgi:hypothetical protein
MVQPAAPLSSVAVAPRRLARTLTSLRFIFAGCILFWLLVAVLVLALR